MVVLLCLWLISPAPAQQPPVHYWHQGAMPPGAIGSQQLQRGGPLHGFFQPVKIKAPPGVLISLAEESDFSQPLETPATVGLLIGQVYRIRVINIPMNAGSEVFPTVEAIDRLYTPAGRERDFPIEIQLTQEDLRLALEGKFVTRVIYLEDPNWAVPYKESPEGQHWFEAGPGRDPLALADQLGRPVAILRMGARVPDTAGPPTMGFLFGCPPVLKYPPRVDSTEPPPGPTPAETVRALPRGTRR